MFDRIRSLASLAAMVLLTFVASDSSAPLARTRGTATSHQASAVAQQSPQKTVRVTGGGEAITAPPAPISLSDADGQELILEDLSIRAAVQGMLSLTELEFRFRNPKPRRMEGRFSCILPRDAAISRFAKEVNGQLMEGEVVERLRANQVYEQFLHRMRDPALLEQDQGNRFSARIFPIEANATVRIVLSYTSLLPLRGGTRTYSLPLRGTATVKHLAFRAFVTPLPGEETVGPTQSSEVVDGSGTSQSTAQLFTIEKSDYTPDRDIELSWRPSAGSIAVRTLRAGDFCLTAFRPRLAPPKAAPPHDWLFYVDTSASSAEGASHRIRALTSLFAALPAGDRVELRAFDQEIVSLTSGTAAELAQSAGALLRKRLFLGGTDLRAVLSDAAKASADRPSRAIVIASDFVATLGATERSELTSAIRSIPSGTIVDALILGPREDAPIAKAVTSGRGRIVRVAFSETIDRQAAQAAAALARPIGASFDVADKGSEWVYPARVDDVEPGDEVIVLGRTRPGEEGSATLEMRGSAPLAAAGAAVQRLNESTFAPLLEREAYRAYLEYLAEREANEPAEAVRRALATEQVKISVEQRVVIPRTTMLVLESEWDYQRFGLDRRALAAILTIDAGGIARVDRPRLNAMPMPVPIATAPRRDKVAVDSAAAVANQQAEEPQRVNAKDERSVEMRAASAPAAVAESITVTAASPAVAGGVEGGVVGGVVGGVIGGVVSSGGSTTWTARPAQPAPPPPPRVERRRSDAEWAKAEKPTEARVLELKGSIDRDPANRELYNQLSEALVAREEWRDLRTVALKWQEYDPENPQVYEILATADERLGNEAEAARADASLIEVAPGKPELLQRAGLLLLRARRVSLAEAPLRRALEIRPDRVNGYRHLALMLWLDGRTEEAARVLESGTSQNFPQWYGNAQRVLREELAYVYRDWMTKAPEQRKAIEERARLHQVDLARHDAVRVTLAWETDANDVDLHVIDPQGEECFYGHRANSSGIELYEDITQGLGPEVVRGDRVKRGRYDIGVRYFAAGPMGVSRGIVVVMRDGGQSRPDVQIHPFRLVAGGGDIRYVASVVVN